MVFSSIAMEHTEFIIGGNRILRSEIFHQLYPAEIEQLAELFEMTGRESLQGDLRCFLWR
jgi:hypothetical protein